TVLDSMKLDRRDPLLVTGVIVLLLFLMLVSVLGRMFIFLRLISTLLLVGLLVLGAIIGYRFYYNKDESS
ncbi:MAG: hypothetical protein ACHQ7M_03680, partial [Chloroflexota bacterium]